MTTPADAPQVHRLHDMVTEEVSLVDRAANKRKFLIVKRDTMTVAKSNVGAAVVAGPNGLTTGGTPAPATAPAAETTVKAAVSLTADMQSALASAVEEVLSVLEDAAKMVDGAKVVETPEEVDAAALLDALYGSCEQLDDACAALDEATAAPPAPPADGAAPQEPGAPKPPTLAMRDIGKRLSLLKAQRIIAKAEAEKLTTTLAKRGAKMRKDRLVRLQRAIADLSALGMELSPVDMVDKATPPPPAKKPKPGEPAATDAEKAKTPKPGAAPATPAGPETPNAPPAAMAPGAKKPTPAKKDDSPELVQVKAENAALQKRLSAALAQVIAPSNAAQPEQTPRISDDNFRWPSDLNDTSNDPATRF